MCRRIIVVDIRPRIGFAQKKRAHVTGAAALDLGWSGEPSRRRLTGREGAGGKKAAPNKRKNLM
jgi:hypothetical protein